MKKKAIVIAALALFSVIGVAQSSDLVVDQVGKVFSKTSLSVKVGDRIVFKNGDDVTHNITVEDEEGNDDDKGMQKPGEDITQKFDKAGSYVVRCQIHPRMKMQVKVE